MAGPSDKARFYLESAAAELNELERKKIFTLDEIKSIAKRRSDFEHIVNARGSHPSDYMRYIEFEKNVDALRRKRIKRMGVRYRGSGQRTIYQLYQRATRKFSGDLALWIQYIDFARKDKAYKRLNDIFTAVARLHPTKPDIWILAANYFMDTQADITNARSYMQRGLRFCKTSEVMWIGYAKLETIYVGKIAGRRKILGLDIDRTQNQHTNEDGGDGMIALPQVTAEDINPSLKQDDGVDEVALQNLASAPILTGAIPIAIFDSAMKQFHNRPRVAEKFFDMFAEFEQLSCIPRILHHVLEYLQEKYPQGVETVICHFHIRLFGLDPADPEFPLALGEALGSISSAIQQYPGEAVRLSEVAVRRLLACDRLLADADADPALQKAVRVALRKHMRLLDGGEGSGEKIVSVARSLQQEGKIEQASTVIRSSFKHWPANEELQKLNAALEV
ncbi:U3 snoRNP protein [Coniothyrium glycines]